MGTPKRTLGHKEVFVIRLDKKEDPYTDVYYANLPYPFTSTSNIFEARQYEGILAAREKQHFLTSLGTGCKVISITLTATRSSEIQ